MKIAPVLAASVFALVACSSSTPAPTGETAGGQGVVGDGVGVADSAPDTNPDGVAYPTENIGWKKRTGSTPGNRIANFKFLGYPNGDNAGGLQPISLAQFFDPSGAKYRIIHLQAAGVWCTFCKQETSVVVPMKAQLEAKKAVWIVSLAEGPTQGTASTQKDLDGWIANFKSPYTHVLDPSNKNLGPFYDASALPWNANIDARTMEILTAGTGAVVSTDGINKEIDDALKLADATTTK